MSIERHIDTSGSRPARPEEAAHARRSEPVETEFLTLNVRLADGSHFKCEAAAGFRVVELIRAYGLPIKAECGGSGVCATCHVRIGASWQARLPAASDDELAKLDEIPTADETSRLACQIEMTGDLDGLELTLDPDSLLPQTIWTAG